jgi:positive phototaxis protein PixI
METNSVILDPKDRSLGDSLQLLKFRLADGSTVAIEITQVVELLNLSIDRIVPIPHLPSTVLGIYNWRGEMLWITDLAAILKLENTTFSSLHNYPTLVIGNGTNGRLDRSSLGLVVAEVLDIEWYPKTMFSTSIPTKIDSSLNPFLAGYIQSIGNDEIIYILDAIAILERANLHSKL